ncbi:intermembrane transport protein PqiB [Marivita sp. S0852]|uniref:PqiB family protein n=1 Tax=Marivita sp. S0852 TaxID=3373893 RepID=UPI0039825BE7
MSEPTASEMKVTPPRKSFWRNLSIVWLVPVLALVVSLGIAWQNFANRGTLIQISFGNASGVVAGETTIRYRDVVVGQVENVQFTEDLGRVIVSARVDNDVVPFMDADAAFWVVRAEVSASGISGLSTVLSGVYIEGAWDNVPGEETRNFIGADTPPLTQPGRPGRRITLATDDGTTISYGSPVLYRGVQVGRLETPRLSADGRNVLVDAFIDSPHDARLSQATRFWDTSGFEVSFGAAGFSVDFDSISSLLSGGVEFDNLYDDGEDIGAGYVFTLYEDEEEARRNRLVRGPAQGVAFSILFDESVDGLEAGDDVTYQGLDVGIVTELRSRIVETPFGPELSLLVNVAIDPLRMGLPPETTPEETVEFFRFAVATGLRARLATESLLSSDLRVELVVLDDAQIDNLAEIEGEAPRLPSIESNLSDFTATAEGVLERINALPIEEVMEQAISLMDAVETLARSDDLQRVPGAAVALLDDTRTLVGSDAVQSIPAVLTAAIEDVRAIIADLEEQGAVAALGRALRNLDRAMADISVASQDAPALTQNLREITETDIPKLLTELEAVATTANALELQALVDSATGTLRRVDALIGSDETMDLPGTLNDALTEMRLALAELRDGGVVENLNATLQSASDAAGSVAASVEDLPQLTARLERLVAETEAVVASYGARSDFNSQTLSALREVQNAAKSISELARAIERSPNSLIFGR